MFDLGFSELLIVAVVALVVLGPERLPKATRFAGLWVRRARNQWASVKDELERDLASEDLKNAMKEARDAVRDTEQSVRASADEAREEFDQMRSAVAADSTVEGAAAAEGTVDEPQETEERAMASSSELIYEEDFIDEPFDDSAPGAGEAEAEADPEQVARERPASDPAVPDVEAEPRPDDERRNS